MTQTMAESRSMASFLRKVKLLYNINAQKRMYANTQV